MTDGTFILDCKTCGIAYDNTALIAERDNLRARFAAAEALIQDPMQHHKNSAEAAGRYSLNPGELAYAWRMGLRTDESEIEWALVDALGCGGCAAWPGDGVGMARNIVLYWKRRAEAAERRNSEGDGK